MELGNTNVEIHSCNKANKLTMLKLPIDLSDLISSVIGCSE